VKQCSSSLGTYCLIQSKGFITILGCVNRRESIDFLELYLKNHHILKKSMMSLKLCLEVKIMVEIEKAPNVDKI
jgi:hypothetical protein